MTQRTENRNLYDRGRAYARRVNRSRTLKDIAKKDGEGVKEVQTAVDFAGYVDAIAAVVPAARDLILDGGHPHLTSSVVGKIRAGSEQRIKAAMSRAVDGLHPFAPAPPADWDGDRSLWHHDLDRLGKAGTLLERVVAAVERPKAAISVAARTNLMVHATAIGADLDALRLVTDA